MVKFLGLLAFAAAFLERRAASPERSANSRAETCSRSSRCANTRATTMRS